MTIPMFDDPMMKVLVKIPLDGDVELHTYPLDTPLEVLWEVASDMLGTPLAIMHPLETNTDRILRARLFTMKQGEGLEVNHHVTDGLMEGLGVLSYMEGDVVLALEPGFLEAK